MRRTLLAIGCAVLVSMMFAPHKEGWGLLKRIFYVELTEQEKGPKTWYDADRGGVTKGYDRSSYSPNWCNDWRWFPVFWQEGEHGHVLWSDFLAQTAFLAVLSAVLMNVRKPRQG